MVVSSITKPISSRIVRPIDAAFSSALELYGGVFWGQSNTTGFQPPPYDWDAILDAPDPNILMYSYGTARTLQGGGNQYDVGVAGDMIPYQFTDQNFWTGATTARYVNWILSYLKNLRAANPNLQIGVVNTADNATGFDYGVNPDPDKDWHHLQPAPDSEGGTKSISLYQNLVNATNLLKAKGYPIKFLAGLQGEYQGYLGRDGAYGFDGQFVEMVEAWRSDCDIPDDCKILIGTICGQSVDEVDDNTDFRQNLEADQLNIAKYCPRSGCVDNSELTHADTNDETHFTGVAHRGGVADAGKGGIGLEYSVVHTSIVPNTYSGTIADTAPTLIGSPSQTQAGPLTGDGNAYHFDGSSQYGTIDISGMSLDFGVAVSGFVYFDDLASTRAITSLGDADATINFYRAVALASGRLDTTVNPSADWSMTNGPTVSAGRWIPFVYQTGSYRGVTHCWLYMDGKYTPLAHQAYEPDPAAPATWNANVDVLWLARFRNNASGMLKGALAHLAVYPPTVNWTADYRHDLMKATTRDEYKSIANTIGASIYSSLCLAS